MDFSFDPDQAKKYGIEEAIIIRLFTFWIHKNRTEGRNHHDGRTWTFNTVSGWQEHFPFWSIQQVRRTLERMQAKGIVVTGNYNKTPMDRTIWYAFFDESIFLPEQIHLPNPTNPFAESDKTIPVTNHISTQEEPHKAALPKDSHPVILATLLLTEHRKTDEKFLIGKEEASIQRWATDIEKLIRIDNRTPEEIRAVILWAQAPGCFWAPNILSGAKLREKFPTLITQASRSRQNSTPLFDPQTELTDLDRRLLAGMKNR